jgi:hypothetical protein
LGDHVDGRGEVTVVLSGLEVLYLYGRPTRLVLSWISEFLRGKPEMTSAALNL